MVIDPIQSVKGKVVIDAFRLINPQTLMLGQEPRQTTSNVGHLNKPSIQALIHGLNRHYYSIAVAYLKGRGSGNNQEDGSEDAPINGAVGGEQGMLMNLHKSVWTEALTMADFKTDGTRNLDRLKRLVTLAEGYEKRVKEETELTKEQLRTRYVGKVDPKKRESLFVVSFIACGSILLHCLLLRTSLTDTARQPCRYRGCRNRNHRGQHRVCVAADDRQGSMLTARSRPEGRVGAGSRQDGC